MSDPRRNVSAVIAVGRPSGGRGPERPTHSMLSGGPGALTLGVISRSIAVSGFLLRRHDEQDWVYSQILS